MWRRKERSENCGCIPRREKLKQNKLKSNVGETLLKKPRNYRSKEKIERIEL